MVEATAGTVRGAAATGIAVDDETRSWVEGLSDQLHEQLAGFGLVQQRQQSDLK